MTCQRWIKSTWAFGRAFEAKFVTQGMEDNRTVKESLDIAWDILSLLPKSELDRLSDEIIENFYRG